VSCICLSVLCYLWYSLFLAKAKEEQTAFWNKILQLVQTLIEREKSSENVNDSLNIDRQILFVHGRRPCEMLMDGQKIYFVT
jgi:hypothetical protein